MAETATDKWLARLGIAFVVGAVAALIWFGVREGLESSHRKSCRGNLQQIAAALQAYHEQYKSFPPAYVLGPDGEPYHSWRVVLLPFLDEQNLYDQYRFDEPWNGPHNRTLIEQIPKLYACPSATGQKPGTTNYLAVVGRGTCWPEQYSIRYEDIHDGTSNTVQLVESSNSSVQWLEPRDIAYREAQSHGKPAGHPTPSSRHLSATNANSQGGFHVTLADGSVKFLNHQIDPKIFRSLLSINGGRPLARVDWPALDLPEPLELPPPRPAEEFPSTDVLPYPTGPITRGRNYVYCATFEIAWDEARKALGGGPIVLEGDPPLAQMLNSHSFNRRNLDPNSYLARGGPGSSEARTQIREELAAKFPKSELRSLNQIQGERWLLLYTYLLKSLRFETEFELLPKPLMFLAAGREKPVVGFGIARLDDSIAQGEQLQAQVRILDYKSDDDFVVQLLPADGKDQIVLAKVPPASTLSETIAAVSLRISQPDPLHTELRIVNGESLGVPRIVISVERRFSEIIDRDIGGTIMHVGEALQTVKFGLDETGALLESEAVLIADNGGGGAHHSPVGHRKFIFDRPFLIYLIERDADQPYFAAWIETAELLVPMAK